MYENFIENKKLYICWILSIFIIALSVVTNSYLSLLALGIFIYLSFTSDIDDTLCFLLVLFPFANIFKMVPKTTSLFTLCECIFVFCFLFKSVKIKRNFICASTVFAIFMLLNDFSETAIFPVIKVMIGFFIIYISRYIHSSKLPCIGYLLSLTTILMLLLSHNETYFEYYSKYISDLNMYRSQSGISVMREGGFMGDPNYCSLLIIITLCFVWTLFYYEYIGKEVWAVTLILAPMGLFSYSKSYLLSLAALSIIISYFVLFNKHKKQFIFSSLVIIGIVYYSLQGQFDSINIIIDRFILSGDDWSTGRNWLNNYYIENILKDVNMLFLGAGITADRIDPMINNVHNIYIEALFKFGLIGVLFYLSTLSSAIYIDKNKKRKIINYITFVFTLLMFFFLAGINNYSLPFYIVIALLAVNTNRKINSTKGKYND